MRKRYTPSQADAQQRWDKVNIRRIVLKLVRTTDADIIEHLENKDNMQGYIKDLIRKDIKEKGQN